MNSSSCQDVQMPMATDVAETRDAFVFTADLPGVQKQNTKVCFPPPSPPARAHPDIGSLMRPACCCSSSVVHW